MLAWSDGSLGYVLLWWAASWALGAVAWFGLQPWTRAWNDAGWSIARHVGLLAAALIVWVPAHLVPIFGQLSALTSVLVLAAAAWSLRRRSRHCRAPRLEPKVLLAAEMRFVLPYASFLLMRGINGDLVGLEKFMDFGFLNIAFYSASMPPLDPWFSGHAINYYYFNHYVAAFLCRLTGTPPRFGYNLMLATIFAGVFQLTWSIVSELTAGSAARVRRLAAATGALWITMGGNVHAFLYGLLRPQLVMLGLAAAPAHPFLISDPTRFVGFDPPAPDKLITEFPAYAFYVGDLHAHLANLPNVLLFLCAALGWLRAFQAGAPAIARGWLAGAAALLGLFVAANTWDAAMYGLFLGLLLAWNFARRWAADRTLVPGVVDAAIAAGTAGFVAIWFLAAFQPPGSGIGATHSHTPLWQWLVLYGEQAALAVLGLALRRGRRAGAEYVMVLALVACGTGFAIVPEFVYLKDIYGSEYYRANTAFKFGFQAFLLLTVGASVCIATLIDRAIRLQWRPALVVLGLEALLLPPLCYGWFVASGALGTWRQRDWSIDGGRHLARHAEDAQIVRWLDANRRPGAVLVEAAGDSYTFAARISTYAAIPAVLGWPVHELLWRNLDPEVGKRRQIVAALYGTGEAGEVRAIAACYGATWVVVGGLEREMYPNVGAAVRSAGRVVFEAGQSFIVELSASQSVLESCRNR